jgi:hypothetical protein
LRGQSARAKQQLIRLQFSGRLEPQRCDSRVTSRSDSRVTSRHQRCDSPVQKM